ncbi:MAG: hypothetical protein ABI680_21185 [Chthoniobacteraceae bacterium]
MNPDDLDSEFEKRLSRLPLRTVPADWRDEILSSNNVSGNEAEQDSMPVRVWTWRDWLWPSPYAWGALAAVWIGCFALNAASTPDSIGSTKSSPSDPSATAQVLYAFQLNRNFDELTIR